jgi:hypothetical protein
MGRNPDYSSGTPMSRTSGSIAYCGQAESSRTGRLWNGPPICCGRFTSRHFYLSRSERLGFALGVPQPALSARNPHAVPTDWADERGLSDRSALRGLLCESQWLLSVVGARTKPQSASAGRSYFGRPDRSNPSGEPWHLRHAAIASRTQSPGSSSRSQTHRSDPARARAQWPSQAALPAQNDR